jgi:ethanolamine ammonia-lyase small subunit
MTRISEPKEKEEDYSKMKQKNPAAVQLGRKGGQARAKNMRKLERSLAAQKAVNARWAKVKEGK